VERTSTEQFERRDRSGSTRKIDCTLPCRVRHRVPIGRRMRDRNGHASRHKSGPRCVDRYKVSCGSAWHRAEPECGTKLRGHRNLGRRRDCTRAGGRAAIALGLAPCDLSGPRRRTRDRCSTWCNRKRNLLICRLETGTLRAGRGRTSQRIRMLWRECVLIADSMAFRGTAVGYRCTIEYGKRKQFRDGNSGNRIAANVRRITTICVNSCRTAEAMSHAFDSLPPARPAVKMQADRLWIYAAEKALVSHVNLPIYTNCVTAIVGPTGAGKSSLLRAFNRLHDTNRDIRVEGTILLDDVNIYDAAVNVSALRRLVGMIFQQPSCFPGLSIQENVLSGLRLSRTAIANPDDAAEQALTRVDLWNSLKDRLGDDPARLSRGEQQRLCIARCLALTPQVILLDDPCAQLDPVATTRMEELFHDLKSDYSLVIVTHNLQQAARVSDYTAFLDGGELIEFNEADIIFTRPAEARTEDYITGRFG
jgi:phosphate transport system ATP-binding protein